MKSAGQKNSSLGTVLFVDDKSLILKTVERFLEDAPFTVLTAGSASDGLKILEQKDISMVVSDYKMPDIDGLEFLKTVKTRFPNVRRAIGTGYMDELTSVKSVDNSTVSTFFQKPWNFSIIRKEITHVLRVQKVLQKKDLLETINEIEKLPTLPKLYQKFMESMERGDSAHQIAELLEQDASITTNIIRVANSSFYGTHKTSSLNQALMKIGFQNVKNILITIALTNQLDWSEEQQFILQDIFRRSSLVNACFYETHRMITGLPPDKSETSMGLLYNIGLIILLQFFPELYQEILQHRRKNKTPSFYASETELGYEGRTHAEIGAYLLQWWNFPQKIVEIALFHHTPELVNPEYREIAELLHYAECFTSEVIANPNKETSELPQYTRAKLTAKQMEALKQNFVEKMDTIQNNLGFYA